MENVQTTQPQEEHLEILSFIKSPLKKPMSAKWTEDICSDETIKFNIPHLCAEDDPFQQHAE
jgi:hypothetical protein